MDRKIILVILLIIIAFFLGLFLRNFTGFAVKEQQYSYTKAICNEKNECIDVEVSCFGNIVERIKPVSQIVNFSTNISGITSNNVLCS